jgi:hypothetical protein
MIACGVAGSILNIFFAEDRSDRAQPIGRGTRLGADAYDNLERFYNRASEHWLNAIEGFFAKLTKKRLKRGVFRSLRELKDAIHRFLDDTSANPKPFIWTKDPNKIVAAVRRGHQALDSIH